MIRRALGALLLLAAGAALGGCGGGDPAAGGATTRPTAVCTPTTGAAVPALVLGDSNLFESGEQVDAAFRRAGFAPTLRGVPGFGLKDLAYWRDELPALLATDPAVVVVALGTNDTAARADVDAFPARLDALLRRVGNRPVVWVTHVDPRPGQVAGGAGTVNAAIRAAPARWPDLTVLDRTAALATDPSLLRDDALHFTEAGKVVFAEELAAAARARVPIAAHADTGC